MNGVAVAEQELDLEEETKFKSLSGKDLPQNWPRILTDEEVYQIYQAARDPGEDPNLEPQYAHIEKLSYELKHDEKRLRMFAVWHQKDMKGPDDPNMAQYEILEQKFKESPPELVLYEGYIDNPNYPLTREQALQYGEKAWVNYLVQQHNANLKEGEKPIILESADHQANELPNEQRDKFVVENIARKLNQYNKVDVIMGSGHANRERPSLEEFFK